MKKVEFFKHQVGKPELDSLRETIDSVFITLGPRVAEFEARFGEAVGLPEVVGVTSCSMGLILALRALEIGVDDEVITTPMTFVSTPNAALHVGARPVFADIDETTGLMSVDSVAAAITPKTRAIVPVHLYGQICDMRGFRELADKHDLALIEDSAHTVVGRRGDIKPGHFADAIVYSFYPTKAMTAGDGGAVATRSGDIAERIRRLRNHCVDRDAVGRYGDEKKFSHWDITELGYKASMTDVMAALLIPQVARLEGNRKKRAEISALYDSLLADHPLIDRAVHHRGSGHHLYTIRVPGEFRDRLATQLQRLEIGCTVNYRSIPELTLYRQLGYSSSMYPVSKEFGATTLSLPLWPNLRANAVRYVSRVVREQIDHMSRNT